MEPFPPRNSIECTVVSSPELDMIVGELDKKLQPEGTLNDGGGRGERLQLGDPFDDSVGETQLEGPLNELQERAWLESLQSMNSYIETRAPEELDRLIFYLERLYRMLIIVSCDESLVETVARVTNEFQDIHYSSVICRDGSLSHPNLIINGKRGRPHYDVDKEQMEYLLQLRFSCPEIARIMGVSLSTVRRRMTLYGLSVHSLYSNISDSELDEVVKEICRLFPNSGYRMIEGHLLSRSYRLPQTRIRESLHRVDPEGVATRWAVVIRRRKYFVKSPLSLWHIDGNHKLIRYID